MLSVYPFGSGSLYTAKHAITASYAISASRIQYVVTASNGNTVVYPQSGSRGKSICLLNSEQYDLMITCGSLETCSFLNSWAPTS